MKDLFDVVYVNNLAKIGNLKTEAHSSVKSTKYFPVFLMGGKKMIFKPLSKTKPLTTPLFAYSEVFWSYIINKYFDESTPRYYLAVCKGMENDQSKYFDQGVLVESINPNDEEMINLYDYYEENPDELVDIKEYVNYCMKNYDYSKILQSSFVRNNKRIGEQLSYQILLSILRQDQNFHYENVNFYKEDMVVTPPIDFEFSTPFLYPDKPNQYKVEMEKYISALQIKYEEDQTDKIFKMLGIDTTSCLKRNVCTIVKLYPNVVASFIRNLEDLINDLPQIILDDENNYIGPLNSDYWEVGHALYKENDLEKYKELKEKILLESIDKDKLFERISTDILKFSKFYDSLLKKYLFAYFNEINDLENLTIKQLIQTLNIKENDLENIDLSKLILNNKSKGR